jgi:hypothetical protein
MALNKEDEQRGNTEGASEHARSVQSVNREMTEGEHFSFDN